MSKVLRVDQGDYIVQVENGRTIIENDFMVKGKPLGTAPIVTNVLYVTMEGSDTNDGSAQDPTRACRTVSGAVKSPLYQPGTSIKVAAGHYYENNPIVVKPYTSVIGSDLRTTSLEPINKTQDLFHVNSSSYIAQMQFINGRSGIVDPNLDRGAYTIAFPNVYGSAFTGDTVIDSPIITGISSVANLVIGMEIISPSVVVNGNTIPMFTYGTTVVSIDSATQVTMSSIAVKSDTIVNFMTGKITVYKSPYVQNCTNQTGPWLYDGAMFVPNQTVQIPLAVGTTTFDNGQNEITATVTYGADKLTEWAANPTREALSINTAPQNQGFFIARTLVVSNITFIQEQVLEHIRVTYPITDPQWDAFNNRYDKEKCRRDIEIIVEHALYDTTFGGNSKSVQAGQAYWNGAVSVLTGEQIQTKNALDYIVTIITDLISISDAGTGSVTNLFDGTTVTAGSFIPGKWYTIKSTGSGTTATDFTLIGAANNTVNTHFIATGRGSGVGTAQYGIMPNAPSNLAGGSIALTPFTNNIEIIKSIIDSNSPPPIYYSTGPEFGLDSAEILLQLNKAFIQKDITAYITYTYPDFIYDHVKSERDVGFIVDAVSQDVLLGGNARSFEMAISYFVDGISVLSTLESTYCRNALIELKNIMSAVVQNNAYYDGSKAWSVNNTRSQVFNPTLTYGSIVSTGGLVDSTITRCIKIISETLEFGPSVTTATYRKHSGTTLFPATGVSADNVQLATKVNSAVDNGDGTWTFQLNNPTVGIGNLSTLYFGYTSVYPVVEATIPDRWANRKCDPWGAMGGMLIDGDVVTDNSPVRSFVADAFTQVNQGGRGVRVTNRGYVQLVSVFTIFSSIAVEADNGGIASITNSNANFGTYCMIAKGYGPKEFFGTVYNPASVAYDSVSNSFMKNIYYPGGFFPHKQQVCIFVPDTTFRPHIALMMEVVPPTDYVNDQGKPGFLTATVTFSTITEGDLSITGLDVSNMYKGQKVYLHDQYGSYVDPFDQVSYIQPDTIITDVGPQTIYLSKPLTKSGGDVNNPSYFTLFTCGNAYYSILTSTPAISPTRTSSDNVISPGGLILPPKQITNDLSLNNPEIQTLIKLGEVLRLIVKNQLVTKLSAELNSFDQVIDTSYDVSGFSSDKVYVSGGYGLINQIITILTSASVITPMINATNTVPEIINTVGSTNFKYVSRGVSNVYDAAAAQLILKNKEFLIEEVYAYIRIQINTATVGSNWYSLVYNQTKCRRDIGLICENIAYDLNAGGAYNYNTVYSGMSYYSRPGTYHIVEIEDNITAYSLMPDGAIVNFYQRSYMSASGYLFEYVGAGTNYGALPQVGRVDPKQPNEVNMLDGGKVFFTSTDQNGDFRIGPGLVISQATGVLSGRTFQKSLFAEMTPFILAIEG